MQSAEDSSRRKEGKAYVSEKELKMEGEVPFLEYNVSTRAGS